MTDLDVRSIAEGLYKAAKTHTPIPPLTTAHPDLSVDDAYAVQSEFVRLLCDDGDRIVGYKLGLTSKPMQQLLGVDSPDFGPILASTVVDDGDVIPAGRFIQP